MLVIHFLKFSQLVKEDNFGWKEEDMLDGMVNVCHFFLPSEEEKQVTNQM